MDLLKEEITATWAQEHSNLLGLKHRFAAIDLAPNEQLETGFCALDRERQLVRIDKLYRNTEILAALETLGPANGTIVIIDMPKSLSIPGRWRQEEIKMHPLRLASASRNRPNLSRYEGRGLKLYEKLAELGYLPLLYFNYWTRINYQLWVPFRSRSSQGCRALQNAVEHQLGIQNLPSNLAPSSVLDAMVGAYASWSVWAGQPDEDYSVYRDESGHPFLLPKQKPHLRPTPPRKNRLYRRYGRWRVNRETSSSAGA